MTCPTRSRVAWLMAVAAVLSGCSGELSPRLPGAPGPIADAAAARHHRAVATAEAAVLAAPTSPSARARLGGAYLSAGRFRAAAQVLADAVALGDTGAPTALRLALALIGDGRADAATALLVQRAQDLPAADLGLALALAGEAEAAIRVLETAVREDLGSPALRQNLALAYALAGRWREARLMAGLDLPAEQIGPRIERWAAMAQAGASAQRLALLLRVPLAPSDEALPAALALPARPVEAPALVATAAEPAAPAPMPAPVPAVSQQAAPAAAAAAAPRMIPAALPVAAIAPAALLTPPSAPPPALEQPPRSRPRALLRRHGRKGAARW